MYLINESNTIALTSTLTLITVVAVVVRLVQRKRTDDANRIYSPILLGSKLDDLFCGLALLTVLPTSIIIIWGAAKGSVGSHSEAADAELWMTTVTPKWVTLAQVVWAILWLQPLALGFIKLSLLFFYRRIFIGRSFNIVSWTLIGLVSAWMAVFAFGLFFDCGTNIAANWGSLEEISEKCEFGFLPTIIYTIIDSGLDLIILFTPLPWIFELQMSVQKKLSIIACLMLGGLATAAAFVRMAIFIETGIPGAAGDKKFIMGLPVDDAVGLVSAEMFWTMIETTVALIAICLPAIKKTVNSSGIGKFFGLGAVRNRHSVYCYANRTWSNSTTPVTEIIDIEMGKQSNDMQSHKSESSLMSHR